MFGAAARPMQYTQYTEFQSHNAEFDYLKSLEIEEKINQIKWGRASNNAQYLLSTNDKTIKLWKVCERNVREVTQYNAQAAAAAAANGGNGRAKVICPSGIRLPQCSVRNRVTASTAKRVYANAHTYHINSIALNSDGETFMSADDLRVNLWSLCRTDQSFSTLCCFDDCRLYDNVCLRMVVDYLVCCNRHRGHQAEEHGGAHGGDHGRGLPPVALQHYDVQHQPRRDQARRHAPSRALRLVLQRLVSNIVRCQ